MIKLAKTELQKTQPGSELIEMRAAPAEIPNQEQQQRLGSSAMRQNRAGSRQVSNPVTDHELSKQKNRLGEASSQFRPPNQNPTAFDPNRPTSSIATWP
jgi:hypothetical protein